MRAFNEQDTPSAKFTWRAYRADDYRMVASDTSGGLDLYGRGTTSEWSTELNPREHARVEAAIRVIASAVGQQGHRRVEEVVNDMAIVFDPFHAAVTRLSNTFTEGVIIGRNHGTNPMYRLLFNSNLGVAHFLTDGLTAPASFVYPLDWDAAMEILEQPLALGDTEREALRTFATSLALGELSESGWSLIEAVHDDPVAMPFAYFTLNIGWLGVILAADSFRGIILLAADDILGDAAELVGSSAAQETVNDSAADLISAVRQVPLILERVSEGVVRPLLAALAPIAFLAEPLVGAVGELGDSLGTGMLEDALGVTEPELALISSSLRTDFQFEPPPGEASAGHNEPVIHLGRAQMDFYFDDYGDGYLPDGVHDPDDRLAFPGDEATLEHFQDYLDRVSPALQYAWVLDLATEILIQSMNMHSLILAASEAADIDGPIGTLLRGILKSDLVDLGCLSDLSGGRGLSRLVGLIWRQYMADRFIAAWVADGHSPDCLYEVFCWMRTSARRARIDRMLGEATEPDGTRPKDGGFMGGVFGAYAPFWCDAWDALPCEDREDVRTFVQDSGCLLTMFDWHLQRNVRWRLDLSPLADDAPPVRVKAPGTHDGRTFDAGSGYLRIGP